MKFAAAQFGRVDILVNNAGIQHVAPVEDFPAEKWDAIIAINLTSAFHTTRLALPAMKRGQLGPHHQHRVGPRPGRVGAEVGLRRGQARHRRPDQVGGAGNRDHRRHRATRSAPAGCSRRWCKSRSTTARRAKASRTTQAQTRTAGRKAAVAAVHHRRSSWATWPCSCARRRPTRCAAWPGTWTAAGLRSKAVARRYRAAVLLQLHGARHGHHHAGLARFDRHRRIGRERAFACIAIMRGMRAAVVRVHRHLAQRVAAKAEALGQLGGLRLEVSRWRCVCASVSTLARCSRLRPKLDVAHRSACWMRPAVWVMRGKSRPSSTSSADALPAVDLAVLRCSAAYRLKLPVRTSSWPGCAFLRGFGQRGVERGLQLRLHGGRIGGRRGWSRGSCSACPAGPRRCRKR